MSKRKKEKTRIYCGKVLITIKVCAKGRTKARYILENMIANNPTFANVDTQIFIDTKKRHNFEKFFDGWDNIRFFMHRIFNRLKNQIKFILKLY